MVEAIITGAGRGIGFETAKFLVGSKVRVIGISRNINKLASIRGCLPLEGDITKPDALWNKLEPKLGLSTDASHRILIHNAGILVNQSFSSISENNIREMTEVNFIAPLLLTQRLLPWLANAETAHILFIGSMGGFQGSSRYPGLAGYSAAKSAAASLAESLAEEYKLTGLHFNALALGAVDTEMLQEAFPGFQGGTPSETVASFIGRFALEGHLLFNGKVLPVAGSNP